METQRDNLRDLLERGLYDAETFLERGRVIAERLERAKRDRAALDDAGTESSVDCGAGEKTRILDGYETLTPVAKNGTLKAVLEKAVYEKDADCRRICPDGFTLNLFPKLPRMDKR